MKIIEQGNLWFNAEGKDGRMYCVSYNYGIDVASIYEMAGYNKETGYNYLYFVNYVHVGGVDEFMSSKVLEWISRRI